MNSQKGFSIVSILVVLSILGLIAGGYYLNLVSNSEKKSIDPGIILKNNPSKAINDQKEGTPSSEVDMTSWKMYQDSKIGFEVKYPESSNVNYKNRFPVKQLLSQNEDDGYRLTLTDDTWGKGYGFEITVRKNNGSELIDYWKKDQEKYGFVFEKCDQTICLGTYSSSQKKFEYKIESGTWEVKQKITIFDLMKNYGANEKPVFTEHIIIDFTAEYILEINKGSLETANAILDSLKSI